MTSWHGRSAAILVLASSTALSGCGLLASLFELAPGTWVDAGGSASDVAAIDGVRPDASPIDAERLDAPASDAATTDQPAIDRTAADHSGIEGGLTDAGIHDGATRPDVAAIDAARPTCGTVQSYPTDMSDGWSWRPYAMANTDYLVNADHVDLMLAAGSQTQAHAFLSGNSRTSLRGSMVRAQLADAVASVNSATEAYFVFEHDSNNVIGLSLRNGRVYARVKKGGSDRSSGLLDFNPATDSWWQIRHDGVTLYLETGPTPAELHNRYADTGIDFLDDGVVEFGAGTYNAFVNLADTVTFADVNYGLGRDPWCKASALVDDFDEAALASVWRASGAPNCSAAPATGVLQVRAPNVDGTRCAVISTAHYDLSESAVSVQVVSVPAVAGVRASLIVRSASYSIEFGQENQNWFVYETRTNGDVINPSLGQLGNESWLRIRQAGGNVVLETGPGQSGPWTSPYQSVTDDPLDSVEIELGLSYANPSFNGGTLYQATFDGFGRAD